MTEDEILSTILKNEGGFKNDPEDPADPTNFGITAAVAGEWLKLGRRADAVEMQTLVTEDVAKAIYRKRYIEDPGFTRENIPFEPLRRQLVDLGVNSGPSRAIRLLQRVLRVPVTGTLDHATILTLTNPDRQSGVNDWIAPIVNDALVAARLFMIDTATDKGTIFKGYEEGLESRALSFFLAKPQPTVDSASRKA